MSRLDGPMRQCRFNRAKVILALGTREDRGVGTGNRRRRDEEGVLKDEGVDGPVAAAVVGCAEVVGVQGRGAEVEERCCVE